ncbi:MAG TPA: TspO/MBR family protein [Gaiellales bacterium]|jgi:tryptophan-rich sensory protein
MATELLRPLPARSLSRERAAPRSLLGLLLALAVVTLVAWAGTRAGTSDSAWYRALDTPPWSPPGWVFGVAWTILYACMAVASWLALRPPPDRALGLYWIQLALNLAWSWLFFGWHHPWWALFDLTLLIVLAAAVLGLFRERSRLAGRLFAPYLAWVVFAWSLNAWIAIAS